MPPDFSVIKRDTLMAPDAHTPLVDELNQSLSTEALGEAINQYLHTHGPKATGIILSQSLLVLAKTLGADELSFDDAHGHVHTLYCPSKKTSLPS